MTLPLLILAYVVCGIPGYAMARLLWLIVDKPWRVSDKTAFITFSVLAGPVLCIVTMAYLLIFCAITGLFAVLWAVGDGIGWTVDGWKRLRSIDWDKPARW